MPEPNHWGLSRLILAVGIMAKHKDLAFGILLGASLCLNAVLLTGGVEPRTRPSPNGRVSLAPIGESVKPLSIQALDGTAGQLKFADSDRPTVLYVISPTCGWCKRNTPNIRALANAAGERFRFVGLTTSVQGLTDYLNDYPPGLPIAGEVRPTELLDLGFSGTPFTAVVGADGRLMASWPGAFGNEVRKSIEEFFQARLPGLDDPNE